MIERIAGLLISAGVAKQTARPLVAVLLAAIAFPFLLAFVNVCYWLLSGLWAISMSSPLKIWGFAAATAVSLVGAVAIFYLAARKKSEAPPDTGRIQAGIWGDELERDPTKVSQPERDSWTQPQQLTPEALKQKLRDAIKQAKANRDKASFAAAEAAMEQLRNAFPDSPDVAALIDSERWQLDKLKLGA